jgi:hypothetical protein
MPWRPTKPARRADHQRRQRLGNHLRGIRVGADSLERDHGVAPLALVLQRSDFGHHAQPPRGRQRFEQPNFLRPVQHLAEAEGADPADRSVRRAGDHRVGRQHLLFDVVAVVGGECEILGARADAERIEHGVAVGPFDELRLRFRADGCRVERHTTLPSWRVGR